MMIIELGSSKIIFSQSWAYLKKLSSFVIFLKNYINNSNLKMITNINQGVKENM